MITYISNYLMSYISGFDYITSLKWISERTKKIQSDHFQF